MAGLKTTEGVYREVETEPEAAETTRLLGAGTSGNREQVDGAESQTNEDSNIWDGHKDFEGLPWWRKPSVCFDFY